MVFWNQYQAAWLVLALSLNWHSTRCASIWEGRITASILARTQWTSSATVWVTTRLDQPFPLQRIDLCVWWPAYEACSSLIFNFLLNFLKLIPLLYERNHTVHSIVIMPLHNTVLQYTLNRTLIEMLITFLCFWIFLETSTSSWSVEGLVRSKYKASWAEWDGSCHLSF
jgi:hypothetical protein